MAVGFLIAGASGLCSLVFLVQSMNAQGAGMLPFILIIGGIPFFIGAMIFIAGRSLFEKPDPKEKKDD